MIVLNCVSSSLRIMASILSGLNDYSEPVKMTFNEKSIRLTLKCGLSFDVDVSEESEDMEGFPEGSVCYVSAKYLGISINACIDSSCMMLIKESDGTIHLGADQVKSADGSDEFGYEVEFKSVDPFDEKPFSDGGISFTMEQSDMVELMGISESFGSVDICRNTGVVSYRSGNDIITVVTKYNISNAGNSKSSPNFEINLTEEIVRMLAFMGNGTIDISIDETNSLIKADDGKMQLIEKKEKRKYDTATFKNGNTKFIISGNDFGAIIPALCGSLSEKSNDEKIDFNWVSTNSVGVSWKNPYGESYINVECGDSNKFEPFSIGCSTLAILLGAVHDSSVMFCENGDGKNIALCTCRRYQRKLIF